MASLSVPLFLVREERIVRPNGRNRWAPLESTPEASAARVKRHHAPDELVYVYDVDGVEAGAPQHGFYQRLERLHVLSWVDAGCRRAEDVMDAFMAGAEAVTVEARLMGYDRLRELADLADGPIHVAFQFNERSLKPDLRVGDVERLLRDAGAEGIVLEPLPQTEWHYLEVLAKELRRRKIETSLLMKHDSPFLAVGRASDAFDRVVAPPEAGA